MALMAAVSSSTAPAAAASSRRLSCGIVIFNAQRELLLCHVTGQDHWDLPKGGIDDGETPVQAALRETREETGLRLDAAQLLELGRFAYRQKKDLHLFATVLPRVDIATLTCDSHFCERGSGTRLPEMDGYAWVPLHQVEAHCTPRMAAVLTDRIDLPRVLDDLLDDLLDARPAQTAAWQTGGSAFVC